MGGKQTRHASSTEQATTPNGGDDVPFVTLKKNDEGRLAADSSTEGPIGDNVVCYENDYYYDAEVLWMKGKDLGSIVLAAQLEQEAITDEKEEATVPPLLLIMPSRRLRNAPLRRQPFTFAESFVAAPKAAARASQTAVDTPLLTHPFGAKEGGTTPQRAMEETSAATVIAPFETDVSQLKQEQAQNLSEAPIRVSLRKTFIKTTHYPTLGPDNKNRDTMVAVSSGVLKTTHPIRLPDSTNKQLPQRTSESLLADHETMATSCAPSVGDPRATSTFQSKPASKTLPRPGVVDNNRENNKDHDSTEHSSRYTNDRAVHAKNDDGILFSEMSSVLHHLGACHKKLSQLLREHEERIASLEHDKHELIRKNRTLTGKLLSLQNAQMRAFNRRREADRLKNQLN